MKHLRLALNNILKNTPILLLLTFLVLHLPFTFSKITGTKIWRQAVTAAMSKNISDGNTSFFYPMIDINGHNGITPAEFPSFQGVTALFFTLFQSDADWIGKMLALVFGALSVFLIYKILRLSKLTRLSASMTAIGCPILFMYSSKFMPETIGIFLALLGITLYYRNENQPQLKSTLLAYAAFSFAILTRPYLALMGLPLLISTLQDLSEKKLTLAIKKSLIGLALFIPTFLWYFVWNPYLSSIYPLSHIDFGNPSLKYFQEFLNPDFWHNFIFVWINRYINPSLMILYFVGLFVAIQKFKLFFKKRDIQSNLMMCSILFPFIAVPVMTFLTSNKFFDHEYYMFSFILPAAALSAYAIDFITKHSDKINIKLFTLMIIGLTLGWAYAFNRSLLFANDLIYCFLPFIGLLVYKIQQTKLLYRWPLIVLLLIFSTSISLSYLGHKRSQHDSTYLAFSEALFKKIDTQTKQNELFVTYDTQNSVTLWTVRRKGWSTPSLNQIKETESLIQWMKAGAKWVLYLDNNNMYQLIDIESWIERNKN